MSIESSMPTARVQEIYIVMTFFLYKRLLKRKKRVDSWHRICLPVSSTPLFLNKNYLIVIVFLRSNFNIFTQDYLKRNIIKQTLSFFFLVSKLCYAN